MQRDNTRGIELRQLSCSDRLFDRQKKSHFSEFVDDNEYSIIATLGLWKPSHEVHFNVVKLPFWNGKRLEETCWPLVFCLHSSADITFIHELSGLALHSTPPISLLEILIHLRTPRVDGEERIVRLVHDNFTKVTLGHNNTILEEESILVIKAVALVLELALGNPIFHLIHHGIKKLCLTNLMFQSRRDLDVGKKALRNNLEIQFAESFTKVQLEGLEN